MCVARHDAAPEADVDVTLAARRGPLRLQRRNSRRRRNAVERHVDNRRDAAGRRRARGRVEAFPVGAAGLVDVHVRVDDAGRDHEVAAVDDVRAIGQVRGPFDVDNSAVVDLDRGGCDRIGEHDARAADDQLRVARFRKDPAPARPTNVPFSMTTLPRDSTVSVAPVTLRPSYGL